MDSQQRAEPPPTKHYAALVRGEDSTLHTRKQKTYLSQIAMQKLASGLKFFLFYLFR